MSLSLRISLVVALTLVFAWQAGPVLAGIVTYSDSNFVNTDWSMTTLQKNNGGSVLAFQSTNKVNTAPFSRFVEHNVNAGTTSAASSVAGLHLRNGATWNPSTQGAITDVCFSIEYDFELQPGSGNVGLGALLHQGGRFYAGGYTGVGDGASFTNFTAAPLTAANFVEVDLNNSTPVFNNFSNPDFSASGSLITFGFMTGNSNSTGNPTQFSRAYYFDDFSMQIKTIPEPSSAGLFMLGTVALGFFRRRR